MAAKEEERRVTRRGASKSWALWAGLAVSGWARCECVRGVLGREGREGLGGSIGGKSQEGQTHRQGTDLAFPAGVVVVGAAVGVGARKGGGRDVPEGFALLIDHGCFCGVMGLDEARREAGWAKGCGGPGLRRRWTCA